MSRDNEMLAQSKLDSDVESSMLRKELAKTVEIAKQQLEIMSWKLALEIENTKEKENQVERLKLDL